MIALLLRAFGVPHRRHLLILLGSAVGVVLLGSGLFALAENLPYTTALYWAVTTGTTNTAVGFQALNSNTTGSGNTA